MDKPEESKDISYEYSKIDLAEASAPLLSTYNSEEITQVKKTENHFDALIRKEKSRHLHWRETIEYFTQNALKIIITLFLLNVLYTQINVLNDRKATTEAKNFADKTASLILGGIIGFALGKSIQKS
jgi:hypothetical protein